MRILAVTPYYEPEGGGLERYAHAILRRLEARGHDVRVVAESMLHDDETVHDGVRIERRRPTMRLGNAPIDPGLAGHLRGIVENWRPDVVIGHGPVPFPAETAAAVAERAGIPFVLTYHSGRLRGSGPVLDVAAAVARATVEERMFRRSKQIIAVSPFVRDHALRHHKDKVTIIPPGVDPRFHPEGEPDSEVLFVGPLARAYRWKGIDTLLGAFRRVRERVPSARLHLVGDGDRASEFQRLAAASGGAIVVDGSLDEDHLVQAYQHARVLALPSTTDAEAFGMVLAEANACGRPVIGSRIGGIPDFIHDGENGWLVPPGDSGSLADRIIHILEHPDEAARLGAAGRRRVVQQHDWDHLAAETERVLEVAVAG